MITDTILKGYVQTFSDDFGYSSFDESRQFETFVNNIIFSRQYITNKATPELIDLVSTGSGQDTGFDGIGIIVNGVLIQNIEEYQYFLDKHFRLKISFVFIQSKATPHFKSGDVDKFYFGVKNFFDPISNLNENENVKKFRKIKDLIYQNTLNFDGNPKIYMYYVTVGEWKEPEDIIARKNVCVADLKAKKIFTDINPIFLDAEKLKTFYLELKRKNTKQIQFPSKIALPDINNIKQSFIGSLPVSEFIKMITDSDGNLQKNLFDDNVRHFQGNNKVNREIEETLRNQNIQDALPIFNNGITIITKSLDVTGNNITLFDFQIVNGCQSAHILFKNKDIIKEDTNIIVKIIETTEQSLINKIIQATNKQTLITDEAFESLSEFHRNLEEYYEAKSKQVDNPIYYERRSKQYENDPRKIKSTQIITLAGQIQSYVATVLEQPHSTHRYYGELLDSNRNRLFIDKYKNYEKYYISSFILNKLDSLFRSRQLNNTYKSFRFQILYITFCYYDKLRELNRINYDKLILQINDIKELEKVFNASIDIIDKELKKLTKSEKVEAFRLNKFTEQIKARINDEFNKK